MFHFSDLTRFLPPETLVSLEDALAALQDIALPTVETDINDNGPTAAQFLHTQTTLRQTLEALYTEIQAVEHVLADASRRSDGLLQGLHARLNQAYAHATRLQHASHNRLMPSVALSLTPSDYEQQQAAYGTEDQAAIRPERGITCPLAAQITHNQYGGIPIASLTVLHRLGLPLPDVATSEPSHVLAGHPNKAWGEHILSPQPIVSQATWLPSDYVCGAAVQLLLTLESTVSATTLRLTPFSAHPMRLLEVSVLDEANVSTVCWRVGDRLIDADGTLTAILSTNGFSGVTGRRFTITFAQEHAEQRYQSISPATDGDLLYWQQTQQMGTQDSSSVVETRDGVLWSDATITTPPDIATKLSLWADWAAQSTAPNMESLRPLIDSVGASLENIATLLARLSSPSEQAENGQLMYLYSYGIRQLDLLCEIYNAEGYALSMPMEFDGELRQIKLAATTGPSDVVSSAALLYPDAVVADEETYLRGEALNAPAVSRGHITGWLVLGDDVNDPKLPLFTDAWTCLDPQRARAVDLTGMGIIDLAVDQTRNTDWSGTVYFITSQGAAYYMRPGQNPTLFENQPWTGTNLPYHITTDAGTSTDPSSVYVRCHDSTTHVTTLYELLAGGAYEQEITVDVTADISAVGDTLTCTTIPEELIVGAFGTYDGSDGTTYTVTDIDTGAGTITLDTPLPSTPTETVEHGQVIEGAGASNYPNMKYGWRFGATLVPTKSGTVTGITMQWKMGTGYGGGDGGDHRFELRSNDPVTNYPSATVLASTTIASVGDELPGPTGGALDIVFDTPVALTSGELYHIVIRNVDAAMTTNWSSPNTLMTRVYPWERPYIDQGRAYSSSDGTTWRPWTDPYNPWAGGNSQSNGAHVPVEINWQDGTHTGDPYYCALSAEGFAGHVYGVRGIGQYFVWTKANATISSMAFPMMKVGTPTGPLCFNFAELDGSGNAIDYFYTDSEIAAASEVSSSPPEWVTIDFVTPVTLEQNHFYQFWLSAPSGTDSSNYYKTYVVYGETTPSHWLVAGWGGTDSRYVYNTTADWANWTAWANGDMAFRMQESGDGEPVVATDWTFTEYITLGGSTERRWSAITGITDYGTIDHSMLLARRTDSVLELHTYANNQYHGTYGAYSAAAFRLTRPALGRNWTFEPSFLTNDAAGYEQINGIGWRTAQDGADAGVSYLLESADGQRVLMLGEYPDIAWMQYQDDALCAVGGSPHIGATDTPAGLSFAGFETGAVRLYASESVAAHSQLAAYIDTHIPSVSGGMALTATRYYIVDTAHHCVRVFDISGTYLGWIGRSEITQSSTIYDGWHDADAAEEPTSGADGGALNTPWSVTVSTSNYLIVTDYGNHRLVYYTLAGTYLGWVGLAGASSVGLHRANESAIPSRTADTAVITSPDGALNFPSGVVTGYVGSIPGARAGGYGHGLAVLDNNTGMSRVVFMTEEGTWYGSIGGASGTYGFALNAPQSIDIIDNGAGLWTMFIADTENNRIYVESYNWQEPIALNRGTFLGWIGRSATMPAATFWHPRGSADSQAQGPIAGTENGSFTRPTHITVMESAEGTYLYVTDELGVQCIEWVNGTASNPERIDSPAGAIASSTNNQASYLYISDGTLYKYSGADAFTQFVVTDLFAGDGSPITHLDACTPANVSGTPAAGATTTLYALSASGYLYRFSESSDGWRLLDQRYLGRGFTAQSVNTRMNSVTALNADNHLYRSQIARSWEWLSYPTGAQALKLQPLSEQFTATDADGRLELSEWPFIDWDALHDYHRKNYPYIAYNPNDRALPLLVPFTVEVTLSNGSVIPADTVGRLLRQQGQPRFYTIPSTINTTDDTARFMQFITPCRALPLTLSDTALMRQSIEYVTDLIPEIATPLKQHDTRTIEQITARRVYKSAVASWIGDPSYKVGLVLEDGNGVERLYYQNSGTHTLVEASRDGSLVRRLFPASRVVQQDGLIVFDAPLPASVIVEEPDPTAPGQRRQRAIDLSNDDDIKLVVFDFYAPAFVERHIAPDGTITYEAPEQQAIPCTVNLTDYLRGTSPDVTATPYEIGVDPADPAYFPFVGYVQQGRTLQFNHIFNEDEGAIITVRYWSMALHPRLLFELRRDPIHCPSAVSYSVLDTPSITAATLLTGSVRP